MKSLAAGAEATELIPQKPPFVLVDTLVAAGETTAVARFTVPARHMLVTDGRLSEAGLIEHMAQAAALKAGYEMKRMQTAPRPGFLAGIKNLEIRHLPASGQVLETEIRVTGEVLGIAIVQARTLCLEKPCASCELRIAMQPA